MYNIFYTAEAEKNLLELRSQGRFDKLKKIKNTIRLKKIKNTIEMLQNNPTHSSLNTHKNSSIRNKNNQETFQSYIENNSLGVCRLFWLYGPDEGEITVFAITHHP